MMNCNEYRETIGADPWSGDGSEHAADCQACADYRDSMQALDRVIAGALAIDVPEPSIPELTDAAETERNVVNLPFRRSGRAPLWLGLAASVAIAAVLGVRFLAPDVVYESLADEVIAHLDHEPKALVVTDVPVAERRLARVVKAKATLHEGIGLVTYARTCVINGNRVPHLVIQGEKGPVTLLLMPDEMVDGITPLEGESVHGFIIPVDSGSIAIIGEREERIGEIQDRVIDSVEWSI